MIVYGVSADVSITRLLIAGVIYFFPGVVTWLPGRMS
jgi:TRAP-type C4-dicarboxylate transport system permease large subunit